MGVGLSKAIVVLCVALALASMISLVGCDTSETTVTVAGSTTVQPLAQKLAEAFMAQRNNVTVDVQGGGTSVGIEACSNGTVDIGAASRELKSSEPALVKHLLARDGIAIVVNPQNGVTGLAMKQVREIFAGNITNWRDVGGSDATICVYAREEGSGTRGAFEELVMKDAKITANALLQNSNGFLRTAVAADPRAIGFLSFGYVDSSVKALDIDGVAATGVNVKSGDYPLSRPLYLLTKSEPTGAVKEYIDFCLGPEGQAIVEEEGYLSVIQGSSGVRTTLLVSGEVDGNLLPPPSKEGERKGEDTGVMTSPH